VTSRRSSGSKITVRLCNRLIYVDERGAQYRCPLQPGHPPPHSVIGRIAIGADTVLVSCKKCRIVYYRSAAAVYPFNCDVCSGELEILASNEKDDTNG
jgi:hypothetical protein